MVTIDSKGHELFHITRETTETAGDYQALLTLVMTISKVSYTNSIHFRKGFLDLLPHTLSHGRDKSIKKKETVQQQRGGGLTECAGGLVWICLYQHVFLWVTGIPLGYMYSSGLCMEPNSLE